MSGEWMERFTPADTGSPDWPEVDCVPDPEGDFVRLSDHQARLAEVEEEFNEACGQAERCLDRAESAESQLSALRGVLDRLLATGPLAKPDERAYQRAQEDAADALSATDPNETAARDTATRGTCQGAERQSSSSEPEQPGEGR